jgi:hypothetical protein
MKICYVKKAGSMYSNHSALNVIDANGIYYNDELVPPHETW